MDMTERQVERWWRLRRSQDKPSTLVKFCENMWRFTFYLASFTFGLVILWDKDWLWNIDQCYVGYPHQVGDGFGFFFASIDGAVVAILYRANSINANINLWFYLDRQNGALHKNLTHEAP